VAGTGTQAETKTLAWAMALAGPRWPDAFI